MSDASAADTIRILVATDNHVGVHEGDAVRGDDSWTTFEEIMSLARTRDVDMVLLAGDLFHDHKPSRAAMYHVMRAIRQNCLGEKPCELEMLSDASEHFDANFTHANYEDLDINVAIPVFSIHGNHDDPTGKGYYGPLDVLQMSGLLNYYGKTPESDKIDVKPVLLQKGNTKLALYGLSNVRDERLYRTFRQGNVKFFRPSQQKQNWFNLLSVHQNHHKYSETGWLPEKFLPDFMQLVVWGHEHECLIDPQQNTEQGFHVMQPGSSVATSLVPGEAVEKHVAILSITGRDFQTEKIPLKTVRPFVTRDVILRNDPGMATVAKKDNNRTAITRHLTGIVEEMIKEANQGWANAQDANQSTVDPDPPLPIIRLRVEYTAPEGGKYDIENPNRFSNRFIDKVANSNDVVYFYCKKTVTRKAKDGTVIPEQENVSDSVMDTVRIDKLVREFLQAQSLTILPQNLFGDAVVQFIDKDDRHAMEEFVSDSLKDQIKNLIGSDEGDIDAEAISQLIAEHRTALEHKFEQGQIEQKTRRTRLLQPKPPDYDSELDGPWEENSNALVDSDEEAADDGTTSPGQTTSARSNRARGRATKAATGNSRATAAASKARAASQATRGKKAPARGGRKAAARDDEDDSDVIMLDDDNDDGYGFAAQSSTSRSAKKPPPRSTRTRQTRLDFASQPSVGSKGKKTTASKQISDDEISDDEDNAFEPVEPAVRSTRRREPGLDEMVRRYDKHELLRIRGHSKTDGEVADRINRVTSVKNYVLNDDPKPRPSVNGQGFNGQSVNGGSGRTHNRSSSVITNPYVDMSSQQVDEASAQTKGNRSPTPSFRIQQARAFAAQHASPPGLRVTAGGKIVHDGPWPPSAASSELGKKLILLDTEALFNSDLSRFNGCLVATNDGSGRFFHVVGGRPVQVSNINDHIPSVMSNVNGRSSSVPNGPSSRPVMTGQVAYPGVALPFGPGIPIGAMGADSYAEELTSLENAKNYLEQQLRMLNREEVLERNNQSGTTGMSQRQIVEKRVALTNEIDGVRRQMQQAKEQMAPRPGLPYPPPPAHFFGPLPPFAVPAAMPAPFYPAGGFHQPHPGSFVPLPGGGFGMPAENAPMFNHHNARGETGSAAGGAHQQRPAPNLEEQTAQEHPQLEVQYPAFASKFQASAPEFVPLSSRRQGTGASSSSAAAAPPPPQPKSRQIELKERSANISHSSARAAGSAETGRKVAAAARAYHHNTPAINLDGTALQPRTSHAIEIKSPDRQQPGHRSKSASQTEPSAARKPTPEPKPANPQLSKGAKLQTSTTAEPANEAGNDSFATDCSATTSDFFPNDPQLHTVRNWSAATLKDRPEIAAWLPTTGNTAAADKRLSPAKPLNKFQFDDPSPDASPTVAALHPSKEPVSSDYQSAEAEYKSGFHIGLSFAVVTSEKSASFMHGYRDGLLQAASNGAPNLTGITPQPRAPANTAQSTPLRTSCSDQTPNPSQDELADLQRAVSRLAPISPSRPAHLPLSEQKASKKVSVSSGSLSNAHLRQNTGPSPKSPSYPPLRIFSGSKNMQSSVEPPAPHLSGGHASGRFISQVDGSEEDDPNARTLSDKATNVVPEESQSPSKAKSKTQSSPIKRASSVASSAYRRLTSFGGTSKEKMDDGSQPKAKKEDDPAKMSPAEKEAHKKRWAKRMGELKKEDQAWMEEYHAQHAGHAGKQHK